MPTRVSAAIDLERELLTAEDSPVSIRHAELMNFLDRVLGTYVDPETLAHRFYRRDAELLVEYAAPDSGIESQVVAGFFVLRDWLDP